MLQALTPLPRPLTSSSALELHFSSHQLSVSAFLPLLQPPDGPAHQAPPLAAPRLTTHFSWVGFAGLGAGDTTV